MQIHRCAVQNFYGRADVVGPSSQSPDTSPWMRKRNEGRRNIMVTPFRSRDCRMQARPLSWALGIVIKYLLMMPGANCSSKLESWYFQALAGMNLSEINVLALTKYF